MKTILISGGTGFVGAQLVARLAARGDRVVVLTRNKTAARAASLPSGARLAEWDPAGKGAWFKEVDGVDAVVHLAGEPVVGKRWSAAVKREIMDSRVVPSELLVLAIEQATQRPAVLLTASGVGYYGDTREPCDEQSPPGSDFLAAVTLAWEGAALRAAPLGVRVVCARLGIVLGVGGGALEEMAKPFRMYAGGPIGSGEQIVSWIHLDDAVSALIRSLDDPQMIGPVNVTAPHPVPNAELAKCLGQVLGRPSALRVPAFALKLRFGEGASPLLTGQAALPRVLERKGFEWQYPQLAEALTQALG